MKDVALIAIDMVDNHPDCENASMAIENTLKFIDQIDSVEQDSEEVIYGTFPILLLGDHGTQLEAYAQEGMIFQLQDSILTSPNEAGQSLEEVLELLDIHHAYLCGMTAEKEIKELGQELLSIRIRPYLLKNCIGYRSQGSYEQILEEMKSSGAKVTEK